MTATHASWADTPLPHRIAIVRRMRQGIATHSATFAQAICAGSFRNPSETMVAEILPLLAAMRFLEDHAASVLAPRRLGRRGLPFWLSGVRSQVHRMPFGKILVIGPSNYPLFLPGVQTLQALVAGNSVVWKPGRNGRAVALAFAEAMYAAGLPQDVLRVTDETVAAAEQEIELGVDKVFLTGSVAAGIALQRRLAESLTPAVVELSGSDAVIVLPSADLRRVTQALAFGLRLNGASTCMSPRRVLLLAASPGRRRQFLGMLQEVLHTVPAARLGDSVQHQLTELLQQARSQGASVIGEQNAGGCPPILVLDAASSMAIAQADIFAPVLTILDVTNFDDLLAAQESCPFGLTASIFGDEREGRALAPKLKVGSVFLNDLIVPSADPRIPFGGRRQSGFGVTRGAEGLLEMTAIQVIASQRSRSTQNYVATDDPHAKLFDGVIRMTYAGTWRERLQGTRDLVRAGRTLKASAPRSVRKPD